MHLDRTKLRGKTIGIVAADGFEFVELAAPMAALRAAGATVEVISLHGGRIRGMNVTSPTRTVAVGVTLGDANPNHYDGLFLPGGFVGPDLLRQSHAARCFVRAFEATSKPIGAMCHGPLLLISAHLVAGRRLAAWPGIRDDVVHGGGIWRDEAVVRDRNWLTSRGPQDLGEFIPALIEHYAFGAATPELAVDRGDGPRRGGSSSPQPEDPPQSAVTAARAMPGGAVRTLSAAALGTLVGAWLARRAA